MITYPYEVKKRRLQSNIAQLKEVDWFLNQYDPQGNNTIYTTPGVYIEYLPMQTESLARKLQQAPVTFRVHLVTNSVYDTGKRVKKDSDWDHASLLDKVFGQLYGFSGRLSDLAEFAALKGTPSDFKLFNSIDRINLVPPHNFAGLMVTVQEFQCLMYDHTANPSFQKLTADLEILT